MIFIDMDHILSNNSKSERPSFQDSIKKDQQPTWLRYLEMFFLNTKGFDSLQVNSAFGSSDEVK